MKKYLIISICSIIFIISIILSIVCINFKNLYTLKIKEGSLSNTELTIILKEPFPLSNYYFFDLFDIEKKINGKWTLLPYDKKHESTLTSYPVDENLTLEYHFEWEDIYGKLDKGEYRIIGEFTHKNKDKRYKIYIPFKLGNDKNNS